MPLYKLVVAYDGTRFHGFQRQIDNSAMTAKSAVRPRKRPQFDESDGTRKRCTLSVQEVLEMVILHDLYPSSASVSSTNGNNPTTTTTIEEINLKFAGRTDKGVHARGQVVTIRLPGEGPENVWRLRQSINSRLPVDISVISVELLTVDLDPRRDVVEKRYSYTIKYQRLCPSWSNLQASMIGGPLNSIRHALDDPPCLWVCPWPLDDSLMSKLLEQLQGTHDYSAFVHKEDRQAKNNTLTIAIDFVVMETRTDYYQPTTIVGDDGDSNEVAAAAAAAAIPVDFVTARFDFKGKGFRRSMLRNLVGYSVDVCRGLDGVPPVDRVLDSNSSNNNNNGTSVAICAAPASGLCLESVSY